MSNTNYEKLRQSIDNLKEQYENYQTIDEQGLSEVNKKAARNSVIKCFEVCYDTLWKHLKKYSEDQGMVQMPNSPKPIFRISHENGLIENIDDWVGEPHGYSRMRVNTSHDYSMEKAEETLGKVGDFIEDTADIYQKMMNG